MKYLKAIGLAALVVFFLPVALLFLLPFAVWSFTRGVVLRVWFWRRHAAQGRRVLFVTSESPHWQDYLEANILPRIAGRAVVLNWSERRLWSSTSPWEGRFFEHFAGGREFNPMALVFGRGGRVRAVRFYKAFRDFKHGKDAALRAREAELFDLLASAYPGSSVGDQGA